MDGQADHQLPTRIAHTHGLIHEFHRPKQNLNNNLSLIIYEMYAYKKFGWLFQ